MSHALYSHAPTPRPHPTSYQLTPTPHSPCAHATYYLHTVSMHPHVSCSPSMRTGPPVCSHPLHFVEATHISVDHLHFFQATFIPYSWPLFPDPAMRPGSLPYTLPSLTAHVLADALHFCPSVRKICVRAHIYVKRAYSALSYTLCMLTSMSP